MFNRNLYLTLFVLFFETMLHIAKIDFNNVCGIIAIVFFVIVIS